MDPATDSRNDDEAGDEDHPTDEEQVETEWHFWLLAILLGAGILLIIFPPGILPEIGFALVAAAVAGWILKTVIEKEV
ncbi:hypothetical protein B4589_001905 [Halolamina sp. CBA1230]|uniref:hypothetical protein n=1 Tax=Halolamina sp. CBA1230 TaxID=1853690 RepID=UPI0009A1D60B|nr:hypothetical protein [Halolamina sp. CBA1230]QKY19189.1 hypothetical protein B4589_001905 [Halolamina sp. CBA1230]